MLVELHTMRSDRVFSPRVYTLNQDILDFRIAFKLLSNLRYRVNYLVFVFNRIRFKDKREVLP